MFVKCHKRLCFLNENRLLKSVLPVISPRVGFQTSFPGNLHLILVLRPTGLSSSTPSPSSSTDLGFRFSQDDFLLKMPVRKSDSESFFNSPNSRAPLLLAGGDASLGRRAAALHRRKPPGVGLRGQSGVLPERLDRPSHGGCFPLTHSPPSAEPQLGICPGALLKPALLVSRPSRRLR